MKRVKIAAIIIGGVYTNFIVLKIMLAKKSRRLSHNKTKRKNSSLNLRIFLVFRFSIRIITETKRQM